MAIWKTICTALIDVLILAPILRFVFTVIKGRRNREKAVGFFHPYTNDGGGGERTLWCAVKAIQEEFPDLDCVVCDHDASPETLTARAVDRFGVNLINPPSITVYDFSLLWKSHYLQIHRRRLNRTAHIAYAANPTPNNALNFNHPPYAQVIYLTERKWIEDTTYPRFTMIGHSFGSIYLSWEALCKLVPIYYFDTSGYAFTYPLARIFGGKVICYTHCLTISLDMLSRVNARTSMYNNDAVVAKSWLYGIVGSCAHLVMVNSSWTRSHIDKLWGIPDRTKRVYPPCDTSGLQVLPLERSSMPPKIVSVAQFRPVKAHSRQLEAFSVAIKNLDADLPKPKLQFVGSCRNEADETRLQNLKDQAIELKVDKHVEFYKDVMYRDLVRLLGGAVAGIHSMIDEHFGISVVEYMSAGAIPIAHNSAGPNMDNVLEEGGEQTGFLSQNVEEYADAIFKIIRMPESERLHMAEAAGSEPAGFLNRDYMKILKLP